MTERLENGDPDEGERGPDGQRSKFSRASMGKMTKACGVMFLGQAALPDSPFEIADWSVKEVSSD